MFLTNVIGFDVKVWEPAANGSAGGYVDLGYGNVARINSRATPSHKVRHFRDFITSAFTPFYRRQIIPRPFQSSTA